MTRFKVLANRYSFSTRTVNSWFLFGNIDVSMHKGQRILNVGEAGFLAALHVADNSMPGFKPGAGLGWRFLDEADDE